MKNTWFLKEELPKHIAALSSQKPLWGSMSAQQMIEHLSIVFNISNGKEKVSVINGPEQMAKSKRHVYQYKNPFPKGLRMPLLPLDPLPLKHGTMDEAKGQLWQDIDTFYRFFEGETGKTSIHPVLGPLTFDEWVFFHTKHCSHHLAQFGIMEGEITP